MTKEARRLFCNLLTVAVAVGLGAYGAVAISRYAPWGSWLDVELGCPATRMSDGQYFDDDGSDPYRHPHCRVKPELPLGLPNTYYFSLTAELVRAGVTRAFSVACRLTCDSAVQLQEAMGLLPTRPDFLDTPGGDRTAAAIVIGVASFGAIAGVVLTAAFLLRCSSYTKHWFEGAEASTAQVDSAPLLSARLRPSVCRRVFDACKESLPCFSASRRGPSIEHTSGSYTAPAAV